MVHRNQKIVRCDHRVPDYVCARGLVSRNEGETQMKKLFATISLAAGVAALLASSPALAQNGTHRHARHPHAASQSYGAYAAQPGFNSYGRATPSNSYNAYDTRGRYIGSDPDPRVRDQLASDPTQGD
jgi:hypothetical protein